MAAERLALGGAAVTVVDRMPSPGRKLLMAGVGGLNITHGGPADAFVMQYGPAAPALAAAIEAFPPEALCAWCAAIGQPLFTGSSGRVFPVAMKASPLLRAWLARLDSLGVTRVMRHRWTGWNAAGGPVFDPVLELPPGAVVLAMGGATWPRLGSDGAWVAALPPSAVAPLRPANCGFEAAWSEHFSSRFAGTPLKRITVTFAGRRVPGDATITRAGVEGGPFYALGAALRDAIDAGDAVAVIDLRPDLNFDELARRLAAPRRGQSLSNFLRKAAGLSPVAIALLRERAGVPDDLAAAIKGLPLRLVATAGMARSISTAGGLRFAALTDGSLPPGVFAAGEMLDWEAPTGGYLLQAAFSTGYAAGEAALGWLRLDDVGRRRIFPAYGPAPAMPPGSI